MPRLFRLATLHTTTLVVLLLGGCSVVNAPEDGSPGETDTGGSAAQGGGGAGGTGGIAGSGGTGGTAGSGGTAGGGGAQSDCGNGLIEDGEGCDDDNTALDDGCDASCQVEDGYECNGEPSTCSTVCGDDILAGDEVCDDGNTEDGDYCASDCLSGLEVLLEDDMEGGPGGWTHEVVPSYTGSDTWAMSTARSHSASTSWSSGPDPNSEGEVRLTSPAVDLTAVPAGSTVTLTFWHWYRYDECSPQLDFEPDGHFVEISADGGAFTLVAPVGNYPYVIDEGCSQLTGPGYSHNSNDAFVEATVDLSSFIGSSIQIGFHVTWDCGYCAVEEGLYLDDVLVIRTL